MTVWRSIKEKQLVASREGVLEIVPAREGVPPDEPCRCCEIVDKAQELRAIDVAKS
jgi:hypothetical protein